MTTTEASLYRLLAWLSPAYPIGAFSYSHGLEWAVEEGLLPDRASLQDWLATALLQGSGRVDGALLAAAWRAGMTGDAARLDEVAALARAWRGSRETALESLAQGRAFLAVTLVAWPRQSLAEFAARQGGEAALPIAVGAAAAGERLPLAAVLTGYLAAFAANLISAAVRLVPLGQTDGQIAMAWLEPVVRRAAIAAEAADLDRLGTAAAMLELCSMRHETQYTRLFRS